MDHSILERISLAIPERAWHRGSTVKMNELPRSSRVGNDHHSIKLRKGVEDHMGTRNCTTPNDESTSLDIYSACWIHWHFYSTQRCSKRCLLCTVSSLFSLSFSWGGDCQVKLVPIAGLMATNDKDPDVIQLPILFYCITQFSSL